MSLQKYDELPLHPLSEDLVDLICKKTHNNEALFFRIQVASYWSQVASMMNTTIDTPNRGVLPVNMYAINLAASGFGKGHSTNIIEDKVLAQFRHNFVNHTFPLLADRNLPRISQQRASRNGGDPDKELDKVTREFAHQGPLAFNFDSGTMSAIRQQRHKLLMANAGALNLIVDEIGSNLQTNAEMWPMFLEMYDKGKLKQRLLKNTGENNRYEEIHGETPANLLMFGTPHKLLDGAKIEDEFYEMLGTGYGRRCFFGFARSQGSFAELSAKEVYDMEVSNKGNKFLDNLSDRLGDLADLSQTDKQLQVPEEVMLIFIQYQLDCRKIADKMGDHDEIRKAELTHRHFKAMKLAGAYAFIDGKPEVTKDYAEYAIRLAQDSGHAFEQLLSRDRAYVKLAKYICSVDRAVTQADLVEDLPFYKGSVAQKQDMLSLAITYGYQNSIIIKKTYEDGIEFLRGETLKPTKLSEMIVSYSNDIAKGYKADTANWSDLTKMTQAKNLHWCNHHFLDEHRQEDNALPGFNLIVLDVEKSVPLQTAQDLLKDYKALFYTTKRHTKTDNRYRIIMPTNFILELDGKDYKDFMRSLFDWLPFEVDTATGQRARKWLSHPGKYYYQDGDLLDVHPFIPKTTKNEKFKKTMLDQQGMSNLERWVLNNIGDGNRNNMLLRYALLLVDGGLDFGAILQRVNELNTKIDQPLNEAEIMGTVMVTVGKALAKKE